MLPELHARRCAQARCPQGRAKCREREQVCERKRRCESAVQHGTHQAGGWRRSSWRWARRSRSPQRRPRRPPRAWRGTRSAAPWHAGSWQLTITDAWRCDSWRVFHFAHATRTKSTGVNVNTTDATTVLRHCYCPLRIHTPYMCVEEHLEGGLHTVHPISSYHSVRNQQPTELVC